MTMIGYSVFIFLMLSILAASGQIWLLIAGFFPILAISWIIDNVVVTVFLILGVPIRKKDTKKAVEQLRKLSIRPPMGTKEYLDWANREGQWQELTEKSPPTPKNPTQTQASGIRIYYGVTDYQVAQALMKRSPSCFRKAQDVVVAASKLDSTQNRYQELERAVQKLQMAIIEDYQLNTELLCSALANGNVDTMAEYLSEFSRAFPNWRNEYKILNNFL